MPTYFNGQFLYILVSDINEVELLEHYFGIPNSRILSQTLDDFENLLIDLLFSWYITKNVDYRKTDNY